jgi:GNAT superfamily N-acetyltransferase
MQIRPAQPEEAQLLSDIAFASKKHWGYPDDWMQQWREALTITPELIQAGNVFLADIGSCAGFYALTPRESTLWLEHLWVAPRFMGQGIGRALFAHAARRGKAMGLVFLMIESDPNAQGFYQKMGALPESFRTSVCCGIVRRLPILRYYMGALNS